ncbi:MAG: hypothetical protein HYV37_03325 [Candidatus Levyibacteriota bacterium]|nr:MAG: hypothetical protein HYV37_03325 [Candidatus Levybacteria bacterium]
MERRKYGFGLYHADQHNPSSLIVVHGNVESSWQVRPLSHDRRVDRVIRPGSKNVTLERIIEERPDNGPFRDFSRYAEENIFPTRVKITREMASSPFLSREILEVRSVPVLGTQRKESTVFFTMQKQKGDFVFATRVEYDEKDPTRIKKFAVRKRKGGELGRLDYLINCLPHFDPRTNSFDNRVRLTFIPPERGVTSGLSIEKTDVVLGGGGYRYDGRVYSISIDPYRRDAIIVSIKSNLPREDELIQFLFRARNIPMQQVVDTAETPTYTGWEEALALVS